MKKANPLQGIPQVPKTVAGQWLAFSHMANHYRRLLNVKPRVDTSAPKTGSAHCIPSKASSTNVTRGNKRVFGTSKQQKGKELSKSDRKKQPNGTLEPSDKYPNNISSRKPSSKSTHMQKPLDSEYQLVFGPSSLKSSVDALVSDCESCEEQSPRVKPMGIAEKIRMFLDNAHDSMGAPSAMTRKVKKSTETHCNSKDSRLRLERHSKCFEPLDINKESPKKYKASPVPPRKSGSLKTLYHHRNSKDEGPKRDSINTGMSKRNLTVQQIIDSSLRRAKKPVRNRKLSGGSDQSASVGTIRGSDDLTEEIDLPPMATESHSKQFVGIDTEPQKLASEWTTEKRNKKSAGSNSGFGSNSYLHHGKATSMSSLALGLVNNKDSSRDSAYGFSSGESRITTRESTPEKTASNNKKSNSKRKSAAEVNGKYKSSLSTVASSVNQDTSPVNSSRFSTDGRHGFTANATDTGPRWLNEERYVGFLTEVTDDIVSRGIYTNKGLKSLFNSHLEKNVHLDREKMLQMLDRLRIDVGIPKEDSLNQLEFGYGSVKYSSGPYFTSTGTGSKVYNHNSNRNDTHQGISSNSSAYSNNIPFANKPSSKRISNAQIDDGKGSSYSASGNSQDSSEHNIQDGNEGSNFEVSSQSSKSSFSISETEMNSTLRKIGFDSFTAMEILDIVSNDSKVRVSKSRKDISLRNSQSNREYRSTKILAVNDNSASNSYNKSRENLLHRSRSQQSLGSY